MQVLRHQTNEPIPRRRRNYPRSKSARHTPLLPAYNEITKRYHYNRPTHKNPRARETHRATERAHSNSPSSIEPNSVPQQPAATQLQPTGRMEQEISDTIGPSIRDNISTGKEPPYNNSNFAAILEQLSTIQAAHNRLTTRSYANHKFLEILEGINVQPYQREYIGRQREKIRIQFILDNKRIENTNNLISFLHRILTQHIERNGYQPTELSFDSDQQHSETSSSSGSPREL